MDEANVNHAMIVLAREARGWTQQELAKTIRVSQPNLSRYELGTVRPPASHVDAISRALDFTTEFFHQREYPVSLGGDFLYRRRARVPARDRRRVEAEANIRRMQVARMLRNVERDDSVPFPTIPLTEVDGRPDRAAVVAREAFRLPDGPVPNLTRVIEGAGAIIFLADFGTPAIDGTNMRMPGLPPMLFANRNVPGERHRFNLAHELAHLVMHFSVAHDDPEDEANAFAAEFLMPRKLIRADLRGLDLVGAMRLKPLWGVSIAAIIRRAVDLGQITAHKAKRMYTAMNARGEKVKEVLPLPFEQPEAATALHRLHRERLGYTDEDMTKLLFTRKLVPIRFRRFRLCVWSAMMATELPDSEGQNGTGRPLVRVFRPVDRAAVAKLALATCYTPRHADPQIHPAQAAPHGRSRRPRRRVPPAGGRRPEGHGRAEERPAGAAGPVASGRARVAELTRAGRAGQGPVDPWFVKYIDALKRAFGESGIYSGRVP